MTLRQTIPSRWRKSRVRRRGLLTLMTLAGFVALAVLLANFANPAPEALAAAHQPKAAPDTVQAKNEPWLEINCLQTVVEEGDDFRLIVNKKFDSDWPHPTIRVFWYTDPITADETDYQHLYAERQSSNGYQSEHGRMGRNFHTLEDEYPEDDETFIVRFNNSVDYGHDGECLITITDDDGIGIYDLEITSTPRQLPASNGQGPQIGYAAGDVIEITAHFTGGVTTVNPDTGQQSDYAGIYVFVGNQRRLAPFLRKYGSDAMVFGYTVKPNDRDTDGIRVEQGGLPLIGQSTPFVTGFHYDEQQGDIGIWPVSSNSDSINRIYRGLHDDPKHRVFQVETDEPTIDPPTGINVDPVPEPEPPEWVENSEVIENGAFHIEHGELTEEDGGRDWFSFTATGGEKYIIEVESRMKLLEYQAEYVDNHLIDPSILEIVDEQGEQVLGEHDQGGFISNWARGYFTPRTDGTYYIAVGSGRQDPGGFGHYTISVRQDDHADDWRTQPGLVFLPGQSITARINSDIAPGDADPHDWAWGETSDDNAVPRWGIETADDKDVFRFEIREAGQYGLSVNDGPPEVGIWAIFEEGGDGDVLSWEAPVRSHTATFQPGTYFIGVGTSYQSVGNTGDYTLAVTHSPD